MKSIRIAVSTSIFVSNVISHGEYVSELTTEELITVYGSFSKKMFELPAMVLVSCL